MLKDKRIWFAEENGRKYRTLRIIKPLSDNSTQVYKRCCKLQNISKENATTFFCQHFNKDVINDWFYKPLGLSFKIKILFGPLYFSSLIFYVDVCYTNFSMYYVLPHSVIFYKKTHFRENKWHGKLFVGVTFLWKAFWLQLEYPCTCIKKL